jgi:transposase
MGTGEVASQLGVALQTVSKWRIRFARAGIAGLTDLPRPNVDRKISDEVVERLVRMTLETAPSGQTHWSSRQLAAKLGVSQSTVSRVWRAFRLQPHRQDTFTLSTDDFFVEKVRDVVGLYMSPPEHAVVLCVDEKSQIQALERRQPVLPMVFGLLNGPLHSTCVTAPRRCLPRSTSPPGRSSASVTSDIVQSSSGRSSTPSTGPCQPTSMST